MYYCLNFCKLKVLTKLIKSRKNDVKLLLIIISLCNNIKVMVKSLSKNTYLFVTNKRILLNCLKNTS